MKKLTVIILTLILTLALTTVVSLAASISVTIDGNPVQFTEQTGQPFLDSQNRVQVPLRAAMAAYGCEVDWNKETKTAIVEKEGIKVEAPIGQNYILKNGQQIQNDTAATIKGGKTYLPIRVVLESFGAKVDWKGNSVIVIKGDNTANLVEYEEFVGLFNIEVGSSKDSEVAMCTFKKEISFDDLMIFLKQNESNLDKYSRNIILQYGKGANQTTIVNYSTMDKFEFALGVRYDFFNNTSKAPVLLWTKK